MHMRFDGKLGFPGGILDPGENAETGLNREVQEEVGMDLGLLESDWVGAWYSAQGRILNHFFCKEVSREQFLMMEKEGEKAPEFGVEILGHIRVPLYSYQNKRGQRSGFPQFLKNNFSGNSREQLLKCLVEKNVLSSEEVGEALRLSTEC
ncbi:U8 snoRNA-decapping enzyme isoform X2 [Eurytemora carolleeae]|nr:U8 snoRNA-decapping enzyme isoform X2 [Eurytemora carolleeae]|eukprot:XP_023342199.1 U8 snoRNA-decapping enzyme-like isoform X2 [Eurytemora affinis]